MTPAPITWALRRTPARIRHVSAVEPRAATGLVREVYRQAEREFGMVAPPLALHSPEPRVLAASWVLLREILVAPGAVDRAVKEAVAAAVSVANACPYCVEIHGAVLGELVRGPVAAAIAEDRTDDIADPRIRGIATWARRSGTAATATAPPVPAEQLPELVGTAFLFHYLNRMVHVFLDESVLPATVPAAARGAALGVLGKLMRPGASGSVGPGASLDLLPDAELPADLSWAARSTSIAGALARAGAMIESVGGSVLSPAARDVVHREVAAWDGQPPGLGRGWADAASSVLPDPERPAARLALLTALAPYQVDETVVDDARLEDGPLVALASWASFTAARRAAGWTALPPRSPGDRRRDE